jgi:hypothetical protein
MVRRDGEDETLPGIDEPCCASPAGASPAPVGVGAPGSRSPASGETSGAEARRRHRTRRRVGGRGRGGGHAQRRRAPWSLVCGGHNHPRPSTWDWWRACSPRREAGTMPRGRISDLGGLKRDLQRRRPPAGRSSTRCPDPGQDVRYGCGPEVARDGTSREQPIFVWWCVIVNRRMRIATGDHQELFLRDAASDRVRASTRSAAIRGLGTSGDRLHGRVVDRRRVVEMAPRIIAIRWSTDGARTQTRVR